MITAHMPVNSLVTTPSENAVSQNASIFSKFSSPWSKRNRNVFDFTIEPDEKFRTYGPGDTIRGDVVLSVLKGFEITHLVIALHGYAKVFKHQQEKVGSFPELVNGQGSRGFEYHGNGLASLFQDEQTLCGSGFLKRQVYKFGFELQFPTKGLPSTIDFERGTVAYMISATVTRPTTIAPTITRTQSVSFRDSIDIAPLYKPKVRMISLEPISRRGKMKKVKTTSSASTSTQDTATRASLSRRNTQNSYPGTSTGPVAPPHSPAPSEETVATQATTSTSSSQMVENPSLIRNISPQTSDSRSNMTSTSANTITATTELPRHGALAGDIVPIKVSVTHTKPHARGVIIATLYRLGRIDMHPILPLASKGKEKKKEYEDVYPRSRTGLGGLYFANSTPSSVFRKDLSQSSTMMVVNPQTLTAEVKTSVKVPDDAFPSIDNVPGGMISFTYHVEVVIDLNGKLGESRFFPSLTSTGPTFTSGVDNGNQISSDWAHSILDTTSLRRTKSVVTIELQLTVGTVDSARSRPTRGVKTLGEWQPQPSEIGPPAHWAGDVYGYDDAFTEGEYDGYAYDEYGNPLYDEYGHPLYDEHGNPLYDGYYGDGNVNEYHNGYDNEAATPAVFVPPPVENGEVDEKTRLRQREALLLPSQPPQVGESSGQGDQFRPSAPVLDDSEPAIISGTAQVNEAPLIPSSMSRSSARSTETIVPNSDTLPPELLTSQHVPVHEDKQELERQRLMAQASAPPEDFGQSSSSSRVPHPGESAATAPAFDEEDDHEYITRALQNEHLGSDHLPEYQR